MWRSRYVAILILSAIAGRSFAAWTYVSLHSASTVSVVNGVSGSQQVGARNSDNRAAMWLGTAASVVDLHPTGYGSSIAYGCAGNQQVGVSVLGGSHASLWTGTSASYLDLNPPGITSAAAYGTNGSSQVGMISVGTAPHATLWTGTAASFVDIHPAAADRSTAYDISSSDQVGYARISSVEHAGRWQGSAASFTDLNPTGATSSRATGTCGSAQGGYATLSGVQHAGFWTGSAGSWVDLHPAGSGEPSAVNDVAPGIQVGYVTVTSKQRASVWANTANSKIDLQATLPSQYSSSVAIAVWTDGLKTYVGGSATNQITGETEAILWTFVDPESFSLTLNKAQVAGQNFVQGTITPAALDPLGRTYTTYDNSSLVTTPASVTVPANAAFKNFQISTTAVTSTINTTIFAKRGAITRSQPLALIPLIPTAVAFTPAQVTGGQPTSCRVVINGVAGPGGRVIGIFDNSAFSTVPSSVTVPPGGTDITFTITTTAVPAQKTVTVTARVSAGEKTGNFKINP